MFKYILKGSDRATVTISPVQPQTPARPPRDEIEEYVNARYISPAEAFMRIYGYHLYQMKPPVQRLALHLPRQQNITFHNAEEAIAVAAQVRNVFGFVLSY